MSFYGNLLPFWQVYDDLLKHFAVERSVNYMTVFVASEFSAYCQFAGEYLSFYCFII